MKIKITEPVFLKGNPLEPGVEVDVDDRIADLFIGMGKAEKSITPAVSHGSDIDKMTVAGLKDYAAENDIDLGGAARRADIIEMIRLAGRPDTP